MIGVPIRPNVVSSNLSTTPPKVSSALFSTFSNTDLEILGFDEISHLELIVTSGHGGSLRCSLRHDAIGCGTASFTVKSASYSC